MLAAPSLAGRAAEVTHRLPEWPTGAAATMRTGSEQEGVTPDELGSFLAAARDHLAALDAMQDGGLTNGSLVLLQCA